MPFLATQKKNGDKFALDELDSNLNNRDFDLYKFSKIVNLYPLDLINASWTWTSGIIISNNQNRFKDKKKALIRWLVELLELE